MASEISGTSDLFIVDDDAMMREALSVVFTLAGYRVSVFADAETFLAATRTRAPACVLLDLHLPDKSGIAVLKELNAHCFPAPIFIVTGDGDVSSAVEAVKNGAFDYLVKPLDARVIVARVGDAVATSAGRNGNANVRSNPAIDFPGRTLLTPREREVLAMVAEGLPNKLIARRLEISEKTVKAHLTRIFERIGVSDRTQAALWAQQHRPGVRG